MNLIDKREEVKINTIRFVNRLNADIYILGTNRYGVTMSKWLREKQKNVVGYINDFVDYEYFEGLPVFKTTHNFTKSIIINCIVEGRTIDAENTIEKVNPIASIDYFALQSTFSNELEPVSFLNNTDDILTDIESYEFLFERLSDDLSKKHFENIINFRLNRDIKFLKEFEFRIKEQYFEAFFFLKENPSFIDGGGFDGQTSKIFAEKYPDYNKIYFFEPFVNSFELSKKTLKDFKQVEMFQKGLWHKKDTLSFDGSLGSANTISNKGSDKIEVVAIDDIIKEKIDFLKLDIEGSEYNALIGAKKMICNYRPKIAVCVYHLQKDFIRIPQLLLDYHKDYKIYLRHYTQGVFETVMYFI